MNRTVRMIPWRGLLFAVILSFFFTFFNRVGFAADAKEKGQPLISWKFANLNLLQVCLQRPLNGGPMKLADAHKED